MTASRSIQRIVATVLASLALLLVITGGRALVAAFEAHRTDLFIADWREKGKLENERAWQVAREAAYAADRWYPVGHGLHKERIGKIHEWRVYTLPYGDPEAEKERRLALAAYRQAAELRPTWPYGWSNIAHTKLQLLELDDEFIHTYSEAARTAPWHRDILKDLAQTGIVAWPRLNRAQRSEVLRVMGRAVHHHRGTARALAEPLTEAGLLPAVCFYLGTLEQSAHGICGE